MSAASSPTDRHSGAAIAMILASAWLLATQDAATKYLSHTVSLALLLWSRYTLQAVLMAAWLYRMRLHDGFRTRNLRFQLLRGALLLAITTMAIFSVRHMPLAEFTAIVMLAPVLVTALANRMLNHEVGMRRWLLVLGGFAGTLVMAFCRARAAMLMPFSYTQIGLAALLSWLVFRHAPDFWVWIGMGTIAACGGATALLNLRESAGSSRDMQPAPQAMKQAG